jgi:cytochrome P450
MEASIVLGVGHETTANTITEEALALLQHPNALKRIRAAVEELLRFLSIVLPPARQCR